MEKIEAPNRVVDNRRDGSLRGLLRLVALLREHPHGITFVAERRVEEDGAPSAALGRWTFAALSRLEKQSDADTCATVRELYVACTALRGQLAASCCGEDSGGANKYSQLPAEVQRRVASLNVLITIAGGYFQQAPREEWLGEEEE